jgi:hypothetical protein
VKRLITKISLLTAMVMLAALTVPAAVAAPLEKVGDRSIFFSRGDFTSVLNSEDRELAGIVIADLPKGGYLIHAGRILYEGEAVTADTLGALRYIPSVNGVRETGFSFLPVYTDGTVENAVTVSLTLHAVENRAPIAQDAGIKTMKNVAVTGLFRATDHEGDALTFRLTSKPKRGEVEVTPDGRFVYTPFKNKTGKDAFNYVAVDAYGNVSKEAKISVVIEKAATKTAYADMAGHPAQYAALRLCGEGVYTGKQISGAHYFGPDDLVSRAEMIAMVVRAVGLDVVPVVKTGFHDDGDLPVWFKPYASAAFKAGIISGTRLPDGRTVIHANDLMTLSQAAALLNNVLRPANAPLTGDEAVPAWAAQAMSNLDAAGILDDMTAAAGDHPLTRGEAAMLLVRTIDAYNASQEKSGLLSWVFGW